MSAALAGFDIRYRHVTAALLIAFVTAWTWLFSPSWFRRLGREDSFFENLTAVFFLGAAVLGALVARDLWRRGGSSWLAAGALAASLVFFLAAGEEINWAQRILGFETPEALAEVNSQAAVSLHNIDFERTSLGWEINSRTNNRIAYVGAFVVGVLLFAAVLLLRGRLAARWDWVAPLLPPWQALLVFALAVPIMSRRYLEVVPEHDVMVLTTLVVLPGLVAANRLARLEIGAGFQTAALVTVGAVAFLYWIFFVTDHGTRNRPNEIRECLMALGCLAWASQIHVRYRR